MQLSTVVYLLLLGLTGGVGFCMYRYLLIYYKLLTQLVAIVFAFELSVQLFYKAIGSTGPFYHILTPINLIYLGLIYSKLIKSKKLKLQVIYSTFGVSIAMLFISVSLGSIYNFPSINLLLLCVLVVTFSLLFFYNMLKRPTDVPLVKQSEFWFNSGNLIFYSTTALHFGIADYFHDLGKGLPSWMHGFIWILNLILYGSYLISIILSLRKSVRHEYRR